ncbi:MAG: hypothetical protein HC904_13440 [Blastochloris sp.]|nr:hypothetical protein [Blastochloris sp.]
MKIPRQPDSIDWFQCTWEGTQLLTMQQSLRMTFLEKLEWLESMHTLSDQWNQRRSTSLIQALREWAD